MVFIVLMLIYFYLCQGAYKPHKLLVAEGNVDEYPEVLGVREYHVGNGPITIMTSEDDYEFQGNKNRRMDKKPEWGMLWSFNRMTPPPECCQPFAYEPSNYPGT